MTATTSRIKRPATLDPGLLGRHPLAGYFAIALAGTWLAVLPLLLGADGLDLFGYRFGDAGILFAILGAFTGPLLAALTITGVTKGRAGVRALFDRVRQWRVGAGWYLMALFGYLGIWLAGYSVWLSGAPLRALAEQPALLLSAYLAPLAVLVVLAFGEEVGWRGYALPHLQRRYGPLGGTLILAVMHGLWHVPLLLVPGFISGGTFSLPFILGWMATVLAATFLYTWIFNHTGGSLLIAILVHAGSNASSALMNALVPEDPALTGWRAAVYASDWNLANLIPFAVAAALLLLVTGGRLGYRGDRSVTDESGSGDVAL
jgi:uncharacterized protein